MPDAKSPADLLKIDEIAGMSGLDFMTGILEGRLPPPPIAHTMGYRLHSVEKGRVVFRGAPEFSVTNPMGTVHGGWYGTLLDSAMACAVMTAIPWGRSTQRWNTRSTFCARSRWAWRSTAWATLTT